MLLCVSGYQLVIVIIYPVVSETPSCYSACSFEFPMKMSLSQQDATFMLDSSQSIMAAVATKNNILVRTKAAWSLGNLCDILATLAEPLPDEIYKQLFWSSTSACLDTDKVNTTTNTLTAF